MTVDRGDAFERDDIWQFPCGGKPFRLGDWVRHVGDVRVGAHVRFERVAPDFVNVVVVDASVRDGSTYQCDAGAAPNTLVFLPLPRLSS
ncbi:MAG: hypothetical protein ABI585_15250 [Betaproteobacteria bacterium]